MFWDFLRFSQTFLSLQVKKCAIITYKDGLYELPKELPNDVRIRKLENIRKVFKLHKMIALFPAKIKILLIIAKNSWKTEIKLFP